MKMDKWYIICGFVLCFMFGSLAPFVDANMYPLEIFTDNGVYNDSGELNLYLEVLDLDDWVGFKFYNDSLVNSSIARIYFESNPFLTNVEIINGIGTNFEQFKRNANLPGGNSLGTPFVEDDELAFYAKAPPPKNGVNPEQWVQFNFEFNTSYTFEDIINSLNIAEMRVGMHIIALPDGSSEAAVTPEPTTLIMFAFGSFLFMTKRKKAKPIQK